MPSIAFIAAHDSEFKWSALASRHFREAGWDASFQTVQEDFRATPEQVQDAGVNFSQLRILSMTEALETWRKTDAVVFATNGDLCEKYLLKLRALINSGGTRPIMVAAYCGVVITNHLAGYAARCAADIICVNTRQDLAQFSKAARELGLPVDPLLLTGLAILPESIKELRGGRINRVVYADQAAVPQSTADRKYIYDCLIDYAEQHPTRTVLVKPRYRPWETSYKKTTYPPEAHFVDGVLPPNLSLTYSPIVELLPETDLLITVSSTAAFEAIYEGCQVALVADIGMKEAFGTPMFVGSQLLRTFDQIIRDDIRPVDRKWLSDQVIDQPNALIERVSKLVEANKSAPLHIVDSPYLSARERVLESLTHTRRAKKKPVIGAMRTSVWRMIRSAKPRAKQTFLVAAEVYRSLRKTGR